MAAARKKQVKHIVRHRRPMGKNMVKRMYVNSVEMVKENPYKSSLVTLGLSVLSGMLLWYRFKK